MDVMTSHVLLSFEMDKVSSAAYPESRD